MRAQGEVEAMDRAGCYRARGVQSLNWPELPKTRNLVPCKNILSGPVYAARTYAVT